MEMVLKAIFAAAGIAYPDNLQIMIGRKAKGGAISCNYFFLCKENLGKASSLCEDLSAHNDQLWFSHQGGYLNGHIKENGSFRTTLEGPAGKRLAERLEFLRHHYRYHLVTPLALDQEVLDMLVEVEDLSSWFFDQDPELLGKDAYLGLAKSLRTYIKKSS